MPDNSAPRSVPQVMVSCTITDLMEYRPALIDAIICHGLHPNVMEHDSARLVDVIESSLQMVKVSAAYIGVISLNYGQTPEDAVRNPHRLSITELEFNEAQRLGRPVLLFIMGEDHPVKRADIEKDPEKEEKLKAFRERVKEIAPGSPVNRVYAVFNSIDEFKTRIGSSLNELSRLLASKAPVESPAAVPSSTSPTLFVSIPQPPAFYAKPDYIGRHDFVGRTAQLQVLTDWAKPSDSTSVLLFEAIGGNGKSMLTWEWTTKHAEAARAGYEPWAGRFWYSFYEKGAIMRDFCLHALHYMTQQPMETLEKKPMVTLRTALVAQLHARPWLLVLDGMERVLVAYHRIDAAEVRDEDVNRPTDKILDRDPCDAIRPEDTELLRALVAARPSKILISSRLIPRVLLNPSGLPLPGVRSLVLPGLDDADAERLFCEVCGIRGTPAHIRYYLKTFCDNHPLVISVLAGLINSPGPHRGHFDAWAAASEYGAKLNLARSDLIQSRNRILFAAMDALDAASRQLLSTLALLTDAVDYDTVAAFNPHLPPEPEEVETPTNPEDEWEWEDNDEDAKEWLRKEYKAVLAERKAYEKAMQAWRNSPAVRDAPTKLGETLQDLKLRGLVQYDGRTRRYDLHPVVRGVAAGGMKDEDKERYCQRVVDHFNAQPHPPYEEARTIEDVASGLHVVRTLLKLGHYQQAAEAFGDLAGALWINLEAHVEMLALLRPFFPSGWDTLPQDVDASTASYLAHDAAIALGFCGELPKALSAYGAALRVYLETADWRNANGGLLSISGNLSDQNLLAAALRVSALTLDLATVVEDNESIFMNRLGLFAGQSLLGQWQAAEATLRLLDPMGRVWRREVYQQGVAEALFAQFHFWQGSMQEEQLNAASSLAERDSNRVTLRSLYGLRGAWRLEQREWALAAASFDIAVTMARERCLLDAESETGLALARHHLGQLSGDAARSEAERLEVLTSNRYLALLWLALGDRAKAEYHAVAAYRWAWADGEPYVHRYELTKSTELLQQMNVPVPALPPYNPAKDEPFPWEADVRAAIEKIKAEKVANTRATDQFKYTAR
jgi:hypothetical protein